MLNEFLVLGRVPGTNFFITFNEMLLLLDVCLTVFLLHKKQILAKATVWLNYYWLYAHLYLSTKKGQQLSLPV
jgi:hypothetical protein